MTRAVILEIEEMSPVFTKHHLSLPFPAVLHHFTGPDLGDPHDHNFGFTTHIISGGYVEDVYHVRGDQVAVERHERKPGTSHHVPATQIHRIVSLPAGDCWTLILPGLWEREPCFWRFEGKPVSRQWNEDEWR